jgi:hypothetical protein
MSYSFRNPISPNQVNSTQTVDSTKIFGTDISVLGTGGYMEVFNLSDLEFTIPIGETGTIVYSGNSIPVNFFKGNGSAYSPDVLILGSDNMTSGRRRLGMLVYVHETDQIYQLLPSNYESLWNSATGATGIGGNTVVVSDFGTTIKNNSAAGQNFINIWTASTVEDVSGTTRSTASWKKYYGSDKSLTGGTFNSFTGTLNMSDILGLTVPISGFTSGGGGGLTGGSFIYSAQTLELYSSGGTLSITGFSDVFVTGGTYSSGTITFRNNSGSTFNVTGIPTGGSFTGLTQMTEATRTGLTPTIGYMVYQTNGSDGVYVYKASGWVQMI